MKKLLLLAAMVSLFAGSALADGGSMGGGGKTINQSAQR